MLEGLTILLDTPIPQSVARGLVEFLDSYTYVKKEIFIYHISHIYTLHTTFTNIAMKLDMFEALICAVNIFEITNLLF